MIYVFQGDSNRYISEHFMTWEFRCRCCREARIDEMLIASLEELRKLAGGPIQVTSGYRCYRHNKAVGGAKNSYHMEGMAADVCCRHITSVELAGYAELVPAFGGVGLYRNWVHVDVRSGNARWMSNAVNCRIP